MTEEMLDKIDTLEFPGTESERVVYREKFITILNDYGVTEDEYDEYLETQLDRLQWLKHIRGVMNPL